jgi:glycosyltransferase involved in cell wall biosynthesis
MCRALRARGLEALIVTTDADGPGRLAVETGHPVDHHGVPTLFFRRQWSEAFKYSWPLARWLERDAGRFDVVHIHAVFSHACLAAARACRRHGVPYVVRPLGTLDPWSLGQKRLRKRLIWRLGAERLLEGAAAIHYTTEDERRLAEESLGVGRGVVIPLGVDEALFAQPAPPDRFRRRHPEMGDDPYVLLLSRLHPKKGVELLLEAFHDLARSGVLGPWRLVVAGDGDAGYVAELKRQAARRDGGARVLFTGWLDGADKVAAFRGAALFALPSHQENFGLAVVEALTCGIPVLLSAGVNLAREVEGAGAGWTVPLEREAWHRSLAAILRDERGRAARGAAGRRLAATRFTWPAIATALAELYRAVRGAAREGVA